MDTIKILFLFFLIGATSLSIFLFIDVLLLRNKRYINICNTWQFPMLLALTLEVIFNI